MEGEEPESGYRRPLPDILDALKIISGSLVVVYLIGFVVVNSFLNKYGLSSYELFKGRYISAGILFIALVLLSVGTFYLPYSILTFFSRLNSRLRMDKGGAEISLRNLRKPVLRYLFFLFLGLFGVVWNVWWLLELRLRSLLILVSFMTMIGLFFGFYAGTKWVWKEVTDRFPRGHIDRKLPRALAVMFLIGYSFMALLLMHLFGRSVYPLLPSRIGGGEPIAAQLVLQTPHDTIHGLPKLEKTSTKGASITQKATILYESDRTYVLADSFPQPKHVIEIEKSLVRQVIYKGDILEPSESVVDTSEPIEPESKQEQEDSMQASPAP